MSGHTPGPWRTGWLQSFNGLTGAPEAFVYRLPPDDERETADTRICVPCVGVDPAYDARLMAAAPELLAALKAFVAIEEAYAYPIGDVYHAAKAAISKATDPRA